jgi:DNA modification methylase
MTQNDPQIEMMAVADLVPYARNSRTHDDAQVAQIAASIREFGFTNPVLIDAQGGIIAGHGRVLAARKLKLEQVPCIMLDHLTETQRRAYVIADNKLALNSGWDEELLKLELDELKLEGFDLELTGFSLDEIDALDPEVIEPGLTDEDAVPEVQAEPISKLGDVWVLGKHRVCCGDSTSVDAFDVLMDGQSGDAVFTDPPYGMTYGGGRRAGAKPKNREKFGTLANFGVIKGDDLRGDDLTALVRDALLSAKTSCKDGAAFYVCFPWRTYSEFEAGLIEIGLEPSACIVWDKKYIGLGNANYRPQHEFIFYVKGGAWHGDKAQSDVWSMSRAAGADYVHPTQKPVELVERALGNSSKAGDIVVDCFGGSGSTLIACEKTGRHARLMELDPKYVDVIVRRWQDFTGKQATHAATGATFAEVEADSALAVAEAV